MAYGTFFCRETNKEVPFLMQQTIERIDRLMAPMLNDEQASELHTVLVACQLRKVGIHAVPKQ